MIVVKPFEGEKINVSYAELTDINSIFDASAANWTQPDYIVQLFDAAKSNSNKWVYLRSEGWHQLENVGNESFKHVTVHLNGWTYHCYTKVTGAGDTPKSGKNLIDCISYQTGKSTSSFLYPG